MDVYKQRRLKTQSYVLIRAESDIVAYREATERIEDIVATEKSEAMSYVYSSLKERRRRQCRLRVVVKIKHAKACTIFYYELTTYYERPLAFG